LAIAAESEEVQQSVLAEENFEVSLDEAFREKERIIEQKEQDLAIERLKNEDLLRRIAELEKLMKK
jgi:hypothetical protein